MSRIERIKLQWGHVNEDVEEDEAKRTEAMDERLQWGHVNEDVEELSSVWASVFMAKLQWGHVNEDVEEPSATSCLRGDRLTSMGPRQ